VKRGTGWLIAGIILIGLPFLLTRPVQKRVTSIDLRTIYPAIQDYHEGRSGYVMTAGEYATAPGMAFYHFKVPTGAISLTCSLDDLNSWIQSRRHWQKGPASLPFGNEAFFKNETESEETFELAFRRLNVSVCLRLSPIHGFRDGHSVVSEADKRDLEQTAKLLDDAIRNGNPGIKFEDVRLYQIVSAKVTSFIGKLLWGLFSLFDRQPHM